MRLILLTVVLLGFATNSFAQPQGPRPDCPGDQIAMAFNGNIYGLGEDDEYRWSCVDPIYSGGGYGSVPPAPSEEEDYDPWDFSGIHLEMEEPDQLIASGLDSGKAYKMALPPGQMLNVFDKPNGNVINGIEGGGDVRARYYYTADVNNVWAGVCGANGACGWVSADYLFAVPHGRSSEGIYEVITEEIYAFAEPDFNAAEVGRIFEHNRVLVLDIVEIDGNHWAEVCRMESCAWTPAFYLSFVY